MPTFVGLLHQQGEYWKYEQSDDDHDDNDGGGKNDNANDDGDDYANDDDDDDKDDDNLGQGKPCECLGSGRGNFPESEAAGTGQWASSWFCWWKLLGQLW